MKSNYTKLFTGSCTRSRLEQIHRIGAPSHPSCHLNLAQLGSLYLSNLYATKPVTTKKLKNRKK